MSNSLASVHPELIPEWSERNLPLTPDKITFGSNKRAWWKGACGHEWETSVKARSKGEECPICSGARVIKGNKRSEPYESSELLHKVKRFCQGERA